MRRSLGKIAVLISGAWLTTGYVNAQGPQGRLVDKPTPLPAATAEESAEPRPFVEAPPADAAESAVPLQTHEVQEVTPEEKQRAAVLQQQATAEEQTVAAQVRRIQALMQKEEQDLAQRLAHAAKVRAAGLAKNDQKLLDQAEQLERQSLEYYLRRVKSFETMNVTSGSAGGQLKHSPEGRTQQRQQPARNTQIKQPTSTQRAQPAPPYRSSSQSRVRR